MRARVDDIITLASRIWGVSREDIVSPSRFAKHTWPRFAIYCIAREHGHSFPKIGKRCGGRDHTTVLHGNAQAKNFAARYPDYAEKLAMLRRQALEAEAFLSEREVQVEMPLVFVPKVETPKPKPKKPRNVFVNADRMDQHSDLALARNMDQRNARFVERLLAAMPQQVAA